MNPRARNLFVVAGVLLALASASCNSKASPSGAVDSFATSVQQAAGAESVSPPLKVISHQIVNGSAGNQGTGALIEFDDSSLFTSTARTNAALDALAKGVDKTKKDLRQANIGFVEIQAAGGGKAIVSMTSFLAFLKGDSSLDQLRASMQMIGSAGTPSP